MPYTIAYTAAMASHAWAALTRTVPAVPLDGVRMAKKYMYFDNTRAVTELGLQPTSVEQALQRAVNWFREHNYVSFS